MLFLKYVLLLITFGFLAASAVTVIYDVYRAFELSRFLRRRDPPGETPAVAAGNEFTPDIAETLASGGSMGGAPTLARNRVTAPLPHPRRAIRWKLAAKLALIAAASALAGTSIIVVPDGQAAVRISQLSGVLPGTLYSGTHFIFPLTERVQLYDIRDKVFQTDASADIHEKKEVLSVEAREGLTVGLAVTVRYRVDPRRLDYIQANLPQPIEVEIVGPVVTSAFRELAPNYAVRDVFSTKREEFRERAAQIITARLGGDAIDVKEVLLRKVDLPEEYAQGLQGLLLKEQQDDQTSVDADIEVKRVKIAESQAEALKIREVKRAEADAQSRVIMAKAESDSMQYTLPLKQKQIEQSRLEAEARKEATIQNADAEAQAKVIDSKAEQQRENLLADSEANRIRVTSKARAEELELEAAALKSNPLLVQYTVAQKLSDKIQIMLVPADGKFFFTNDVLRGATSAALDTDPAAPAGSAATGGKR
ncbi:MAG: SPFH domain-containing protein [Candidatus Acidiferrales bacterium]